MKKKLLTVTVALWIESPDELDEIDITALISECDYKFISNSPSACITDTELRDIKIIY